MQDRGEKINLRAEAKSLIDELILWLDEVHAIDRDRRLDKILGKLQQQLQVLSLDIASPLVLPEENRNEKRVRPPWIQELESATYRIERELLSQTHPIDACESQIGAALVSARMTCRRSEEIFDLLQFQKGDVNPEAIRFIRCVSRYLFALALRANKPSSC